MNDELHEAIQRVQAFLDAHAKFSGLDPEVVASRDANELRVSDLRTLLAAVRGQV